MSSGFDKPMLVFIGAKFFEEGYDEDVAPGGVGSGFLNIHYLHKPCIWGDTHDSVGYIRIYLNTLADCVIHRLFQCANLGIVYFDVRYNF